MAVEKDNWKKQLSEVLQKELNVPDKRKRAEEQARKDRLDANWFISSVIVPVFEEIKNEFTRYNRTIKITVEEDSVELNIYYYQAHLEFSYQVQLIGRSPIISVHCSLWDESPKIISKITNMPITLDELTKEILGANFVQQYHRFKRYFPET